VKLARFSHPIILAWGWRRALIALLAGAASALALAPLNLWPIMFVTFPILVWLTDGAATGRWGGVLSAAIIGWCFGFGYFLAGLYWIGYAFLVDADTFGWLLPFAVTILPAGLAVFTGFGLALARAAWTPGAMRVLTLAAALTVSEWLRGHLLTGFPWNAFGYALTGPLVLAQSASLMGLWGLTFVAVAVFASPAVLTDDQEETSRPFLAPSCAAIVLVGLAIFGAIRLTNAPTSFADNVHLRIMQPNVRQDEKFNYSAKQAVMDHYTSLSQRKTGPQSEGMQDVTHLIWPESAFPFFLTREPDALAMIAKLLHPGAVLITGAARAAELTPSAPILHAYNSIYVIDDNGSVLATYDKLHLVPFGEYLPFQNFLEGLGLQQLTKMHGGFIPGSRRRPIALPGAPKFLPLICYEAIFPHEILQTDERPGWLVNVTNDGWFGNSPGPYQHLQQARVRAIEEGLPLVRAANTGISAVIDPLGRITRSLPLGVEGVLDSALPNPIARPFYQRFGDGPLAVFLVAVWIVIITHRARQQ
jgi:apolipoprotein N-acyltransferase